MGLPLDLIRAIDTMMRGDLSKNRDLYFRWLLISGGAVVMGVFLEEIGLPIASARFDFSREMLIHRSRVVLWKKWIKRFGWLLVIGGVLGEVICEGLVSRAEGSLQSFDNAIVAEADDRSFDAYGAAAEAYGQASFAAVHAGQLEKEAAGLRKEAEGERLERIRLQGAVAPRSLSLDDQRRIGEACGKFSGHGVMLGSYGMDGEGAALATQIMSALRSAHIVVKDRRGSTMVAGDFDVGVQVRNEQAAEYEFASCLVNALSRIGKLNVSLNRPWPKLGAMMGGGGEEGFPPGTPFVNVMVGIRPVPVLPAAK